MILDSLLEFGDATSVAAAAGTYNLGGANNIIIDTGSVVRDLGNGECLYLAITVDTGITTAGSAGTIQFQLVSDSTTTIATDGSQSIHWTGKALTTGSTAITGTIAFLEIPLAGATPYERYLGVQYIVGTTTTNAGKVNAFLTADKNGWKAYPDATN